MRPGELRVVHFILELFFRLFWRIQFSGLGHIPRTGPVVLVANHPTYFDPPIVQMTTYRWVRFLAMEELLAIPLIGPFCRLCGIVPVGERDSSQRGHALWRAMQILEEGGVVGIFPEGERTGGPGLVDPVKPGLGRLALMPGVTVVPIAIIGARRMWPKHFLLPAPGKVVVVVHPPMTFTGEGGGERFRKITDEVMAVIAATLKSHPPEASRFVRTAGY